MQLSTLIQVLAPNPTEELSSWKIFFSTWNQIIFQNSGLVVAELILTFLYKKTREALISCDIPAKTKLHKFYYSNIFSVEDSNCRLSWLMWAQQWKISCHSKWRQINGSFWTFQAYTSLQFQWGYLHEVVEYCEALSLVWLLCIFLIILRMPDVLTVRGQPVFESGWLGARCLYCAAILLTVLSRMWSIPAVSKGRIPSPTRCVMVAQWEDGRITRWSLILPMNSYTNTCRNCSIKRI